MVDLLGNDIIDGAQFTRDELEHIIGVDRKTLARTVKPSAQWLGKVARANEF